MVKLVNILIIFDTLFLLEDHPIASILCIIGLLLVNKGGFKNVY